MHNQQRSAHCLVWSSSSNVKEITISCVLGARQDILSAGILPPALALLDTRREPATVAAALSALRAMALKVCAAAIQFYSYRATQL